MIPNGRHRINWIDKFSFEFRNVQSFDGFTHRHYLQMLHTTQEISRRDYGRRWLFLTIRMSEKKNERKELKRRKSSHIRQTFVKSIRLALDIDDNCIDQMVGRITSTIDNFDNDKNIQRRQENCQWR